MDSFHGLVYENRHSLTKVRFLPLFSAMTCAYMNILRYFDIFTHRMEVSIPLPFSKRKRAVRTLTLTWVTKESAIHPHPPTPKNSRNLLRDRDNWGSKFRYFNPLPYKDRYFNPLPYNDRYFNPLRPYKDRYVNPLPYKEVV